jgi:hypothetical protein
MKDNKLEVGDELYYTGNSGEMFYEGKIDRITKTMAFSGNNKYQISMIGGSTTRPNHDTWSFNVYSLLTDDKKAELLKQRARRKLEKSFLDRFDKNIYEATRRLTDSQLSRIIGILEEEV